MQVSIAVLVQPLENFGITWVNPDKPQRICNGVQFFNKEEVDCDSTILQVAHVGDLTNQTNLCNTTFLCPYESENLKETALAITQEQNCHICLVKNVSLVRLGNLVLQCFDKLKTWDAEMDIAIAQGKGYQELLDLSEPIIGNPIVVSGPAYDVLATTKNLSAEDEFYQQVLKTGRLSADAVVKLESYGVFGSVSQDRVVKVFEPVGDITTPHMVRHFHHAGTRILYVTMWCCNVAPSLALKWLFGYLANKIETLIDRSMEDFPGRNRQYEYALSQILLKDHSAQNLEDLFFYADLPKSDIYHVLCVRFKNPDAIGKTFLARNISHDLHKTKAFVFKNELVVIAGWSLENRTRNQQIASDISKITGGRTQWIGHSLDFLQPKSFRLAYKQAERALDLGMKVVEENVLKEQFDIEIARNNNSFSFRDYWTHDTLLRGTSVSTLKMVLEPFRALAKYDIENSSELLKLSYVYINCGCSVSETGAILDLHRNTVNHRIKKIEELCGLEIKSAKFSQNIILGLSALEVFGLTFSN